ncbi:MAG: hypothetical protein IPN32_37795 [Deltaproteobacteria bacterium]|nr:hypothetical protein [Deltaproteobacteria bacterium]
MRSDLEDELRRALRAEAPEVDTDARDALERRLLAAVPPAAPRGRRWPRWLLATGLGAAVLAGACVLPSEYDADLGHRLAIVIDDAELELDHDAIAEFVLERYHPDEVRMAVERQHSRERGDDGRVVEHSELRLELDAIGDGLDTARIWADLQQAFPSWRVPVSRTVGCTAACTARSAGGSRTTGSTWSSTVTASRRRSRRSWTSSRARASPASRRSRSSTTTTVTAASVARSA